MKAECGHGRRRWGKRRASDDSGAALVEFGLVALLLFTLIFGIVDFGAAFNDWISVRQGARDGARQAVTGRLGTDQTCAIEGGTPSNATVHKLVCLTKSRVELPAAGTRVALRLEGGNYGTARSLTVCVMHRLESLTGYFGPILDERTVSSKVQMKIEQRTDQLTPPVTPGLENYSESLSGMPPGASWSFCIAEST